LAIGQQRKYRNIKPAIIFVTCCWSLLAEYDNFSRAKEEEEEEEEEEVFQLW
jgi:hypothetical protein